MYASPQVVDFGRIELHTYQPNFSTPDPGPEEPVPPTGASGGGGLGLGLIGLMGGVFAAAAGRGSEEEVPASAIPPKDEQDKLEQK